MNKYPSDDADDFDDLRRRVEALEALLKVQQPLTEASAGWIMRDRSTPASPPSGDVHIYANAGRLWCRSTLGDVPLLNKIAGSVPNQDPLLTDVSAPASYSATWGQKVRDDLVATRAKVFELQTSFRLADLLDT